MLLLLSCLTGAWAQETAPDETPPEETQTPSAEEGAPPSEEAQPPEEPGGDSPSEAMDGGDDEVPPTEGSEGEADPAPSELPSQEAGEMDQAAARPAPNPEAKAIPLLPPPAAPELIQHLAEHSTPYGLVQVWGIAWDQDQTPQADSAGYGDPEDDIGFKIRRARIGLDGDWGEISYRVGMGYGSGFDGIDTRSGIEIIDASIGYSLHPNLDARAGLMKVPFGRDNAVSSSQLALGERSVIANHITPDRDVGLVMDGDAMGLRVQAGLFNGNASLAGDENPGVLAVTRISYDRGPANTYQTFGTVDELSFSVGGNVAYNWDTATQELIFGVDLGLRVSGLAVLLDVQAARIAPSNTTIDQPDVLRPTLRDGCVLHVSYTLKDMWEPAIRLEWFDDDTETDGGEIAMASVGFTAHLAEDRLQAGAALVHRQEYKDPAVPNSTLRGFVQVAW